MPLNSWIHRMCTFDPQFHDLDVICLFKSIRFIEWKNYMGNLSRFK